MLVAQHSAARDGDDGWKRKKGVLVLFWSTHALCLRTVVSPRACSSYYGFGGWMQKDGLFDDHWAVEFENALGQPHGDAAYDDQSSTWSRSFASGTKVGNG